MVKGLLGERKDKLVLKYVSQLQVYIPIIHLTKKNSLKSEKRGIQAVQERGKDCRIKKGRVVKCVSTGSLHKYHTYNVKS